MDITKKLPTVISFCSGYGGIERGLDLAGFEHRVIAYVEIEAFAIANLVNKMESGQLAPAPIYSNLKTFPAHLFRDKVSLITGGYPCQPFSTSGNRLGADDPRHLWPYIRRHIESIRPLSCFFENVEGHISLGLRDVIGELEQDGYQTTWGIFSAREVGAPHQRKRVYILADSNSIGLEEHGHCEPSNVVKASENVANSDSASGQGRGIPCRVHEKHPDTNGSSDEFREEIAQLWLPEPRLGRVVDGCADRVDRLRLLGNGVVPQTAAKAWGVLNNKQKGLHYQNKSARCNLNQSRKGNKMKDYNGWTNRNTWLINLWFGEIIREELMGGADYEEDASLSPEKLEDMVMDVIQAEVELSSLMLRDFLDFEGINWHELWETICLDVFVGGEA